MNSTANDELELFNFQFPNGFSRFIMRLKHGRRILSIP